MNSPRLPSANRPPGSHLGKIWATILRSRELMPKRELRLGKPRKGYAPQRRKRRGGGPVPSVNELRLGKPCEPGHGPLANPDRILPPALAETAHAAALVAISTYFQTSAFGISVALPSRIGKQEIRLRSQECGVQAALLYRSVSPATWPLASPITTPAAAHTLRATALGNFTSLSSSPTSGTRSISSAT